MSHFAIHGNVSPAETGNSSIIALGMAATFTGTSEDVSGYATITVMVDTDQDGTLKMQFSTDGTNWDRQKVVSIDQDIGSGSVHTLEVISKYFRVLVVNGNSTQGHLRLQSIYHNARSGFLTSSPDQKISKVNDAQIVRVSNDPIFDIARGLYADKKDAHIFGFHSNITTDPEDVWDYGITDTSFNWPITDEKFAVQAGGNAADTAAGLGARTIQVVYLDASGDQQQDQLTLAGASASDQTTVTGRRIIRAWVDTTGAALVGNTGAILIENVTTGMIVAAIAAGASETSMARYTVPLGYTGYIKRYHVHVGTSKEAQVRLWQRTSAYTTSAPYGVKRLVREMDGFIGDTTIEFEAPVILSPLTDIWADAGVAAGSTSVSVEFDIVIVKDEAATVPQ